MKTKINAGNIIKTINTWAAPIIFYTTGKIDWTQADLDLLGGNTKKLMTMNNDFHPRGNINSLFLASSKDGRRSHQVKQRIGETV